MMRSLRMTSRLLVLVVALAAVAHAQSEPDTVGSLPGVEVTTSVDRAEMYVGDLISYKVSITYDSTIELVPVPLGANLGAFDVKDYKPDIETRLDDGRIKSETIFTLSTFTTGDYVIPPLPVMFMMPDSSRKILLSESVPIKVQSLLENAGDSLDIKPLKAQYEFKRDMTKYYIWGGVALVALIGLAILWWYWRKRHQGEVEPVDLRDPWEIAFEKLALLKEKHYIEEGQCKPYYFELTELTREYLGRMYYVDVLEMTTDEFVARFEEIELPGEVYTMLKEFFKHADLVKFAKFIPEQRRLEDDYLLAHDVVEQIRIEDERRRQTEVHVNHVTEEIEAAPTGGAS